MIDQTIADASVRCCRFAVINSRQPDMTPSSIARACLQAYVDKDRAAAEALIADDFRFTSPLDNAIDRPTYFERCWLNSESMSAVRVVEAVDHGARAFIVYEADARGKRFRNCEMHTTRDGKLVAVEVYFGWDLPHPAAPGGFVEEDAQGST